MSAERNARQSVIVERARAWVLRAVAAAVAVAALAAPAAADPPAIYERFSCKHWSVDGQTVLSQTNNSSPTVIDVTQRGSRFEGTGSYDNGRTTGNVVGSMSGNAFEATIRWSNGSIGVYQGQMNGHGLLAGHAYDQTNPASQADFRSTRPFQCAKPTVALGRVQTTNPDRTPGAICQRAEDARGRHSPATASLEKQCREYKASLQESTSAVSRRPSRTALSTTESTSATSTGGTIERLNAGEATGEIPAALMPGAADATQSTTMGVKKRGMQRPHRRAGDQSMDAQPFRPAAPSNFQ